MENVIDSTASINRCPVLADVLNAPVAKLTMSNDVDAVQDLSDARTLFEMLVSSII